MPEDDYTADVALTSDGHALALLHQQILYFYAIPQLDGFLKRLKAKRDQIVNKTIPLEDQAEAFSTKTTTDEIEKHLQNLREQRGGDHLREVSDRTSFDEVKHKGINEYLGELYVATNRIDLAKKRLEVLVNCNCEEYGELKEIIDGTKKSKY